MRNWVLVVLVACGGGSKPAPAPSSSPRVAEAPPPKVEPAKVEPAKPNPDDCNNMNCVIEIFDDFSKQMCACKDKACVDGVNERLQSWAQNISTKPELQNIKPSDEDQERMTPIIQRYSDCMIKVMGLDGDDPKPAKPTTGLGGGLLK